MNILDGKELARQVREQLSVDITESGITPGLAAILVGDDPASHIYVNLKKKPHVKSGCILNSSNSPTRLLRRLS